MNTRNSIEITRRRFIKTLGATALIAAPSYLSACGHLQDAGYIRNINMYSDRTDESINLDYWVNGQYVEEALKDIDNFMRDVRTDEVKKIDKREINILSASHRLLDTDTPFILLSGYRSRETNEILRRRSRAVAKNSLHIRGQAADVRLNGRNIHQIANAARSCKSGGVGKYLHSGFVHIDCGSIRVWSS
ncbi:MAG: DUF882 domain-containing protein [Aestuariivita sp.]|nr:DUF882 domain-containing protein [Aestuariivita sp.]